MLASDLNNPEFSNPINPDTLLHIEFYYDEPIDKWESEQQTSAAGKRVIVKRPKQAFIFISRPGDVTSEIRRAVVESDKARFPREWLYFEINEGLTEQTVPGWSIDEWPELTPDQRRELKFLRFQVVEQIAGASDSQVQKMGMGGAGLRELAKVAMRARMGAEVRDEMQKKQQEIDTMKALLKAQDERMARMEAQMTTQDNATPPPQTVAIEPKKRGWPKGKPRKAKETL